MWFLYVAEAVLFVFILLFALTQIIIPFWMGTALFPFFRKDYKKLDAELTKVETLKNKREIEKLIEKERAEIEQDQRTSMKGEKNNVAKEDF